MRSLYVLFIFTIVSINCNNTDELVTMPTPVKETIEECVPTEDITSEIMDFYIYHKGFQEEGIATGIKVNESWGGSAFYNTDFITPAVIVKTYWNGIIGGFEINDPPPYPLAELLVIRIPLNTEVGCYTLTNEETNLEQQQLNCSYSMHNYDVTLARYQLDETAENVVEILEYDNETRRVRCKLNASFTTDENSNPPDLLYELRLFNVEIEIGV